VSHRPSDAPHAHQRPAEQGETGARLTRTDLRFQESLIHISKFKFSLVISGLTKILTKISEMPSAQLPDFEREHYESQLIVLDTLEKCLSSQAPEAPKYDDVMNVKLLLKEICQFLDLPASMDNSQVRD